MTDVSQNASLLAIVEVDKAHRVVCQAPNCGHSVYRRIHVVCHEDGCFGVYGSDCFQRLFLGVCGSTPSYGGGGRLLTPEERNLLIQNTKSLIEQFEKEHQDLVERSRSKIHNAPVMAQKDSVSFKPLNAMAAPSGVVQQAKENLRIRYKIDPDLPAWKGLLAAEIEKLSR